MLHERTVTLLTRSEGKENLNIATISDQNVICTCKQSENRVHKGENHTKVISSPPKGKEMMEISASE